MWSKIAGWILKLWGWEITGNYPYSSKRKVFIVVPHTSNWDFPVGILVRAKLKATINFVAKSSLFIWPFGPILRAMGGVSVDRKKSQNFVDANVQLFDEREAFTLQIAPEGTRKKVDRLKTSFYWIAWNAKVPLYLVTFDWENKVAHFADEFPMTGDIEKDMPMIYEHYRGVKGKNVKDSFLHP